MRETMKDSSQHPTRDRPLMVGAIVVVAVLALAVVAILMGGDTLSLDPNSPEGVVQQYTQALLDGDRGTAEALTAEDSDCERYGDPFVDDIRVTLGEVRITGDGAVVEVTISQTNGDPFSGYDVSDRSMFQLTRVEGSWRIDASPWPFSTCVERP